MAEKKLADFSQDFFDAWELARAGKLSLDFPTKGEAINFRHRLYSFRSRYRKETQPMPTPWDDIELSLTEIPGGWQIGTRLSRWREQIRLLKQELDGAG